MEKGTKRVRNSDRKCQIGWTSPWVSVLIQERARGRSYRCCFRTFSYMKVIPGQKSLNANLTICPRITPASRPRLLN